jgi:dipeptidyl aminopeptidase/acylaminoacyl peptidase
MRILRRPRLPAILASGLLLLAACAGPAAEAAVAADGEEAAVLALATGRPLPVSVSPDGRRVLRKVFHRAEFELVVEERATGRVLARHRSRDTQVSPAWRPDGAAIAFLADRGGDERYRLHLLELADGRARRLPAPPTAAASPLRWSPDGERIAYLVAERRAGPRRLVAVRPGRSGAVQLLADAAPLADFAWSPDGRSVAAVGRASPGTLVIAHLAGGARRVRVEPGGEVREAAWSPDGRSLLVTARGHAAEHFALVEADAAAGTLRTLASAPGDVTGPRYLPAGAGIAYQVNEDGQLAAYGCAADGGRCRRLAAPGASIVLSGFTAGGDTALVVRTPRGAPAELRAVGIGGAGEGRMERGADGVEARRVDVAAPGRAPVPAFVWRAAPRDGRVRGAVIRVHGGPALQAVPGWDPYLQYLARAGWHVVLPNYRGSTGYGARWERAPGGDDARVDDVLAVRDWVADSLGVPRGRIVLMGHSYGARLAAAAAGRDPRGFGGVVLASLPPGPAVRCAGTVPRLLAFHGENDGLQPPSAARAQLARFCGGTPLAPAAELRVLPDEGHSFHRVESWARVHAGAAGLLDGPGAP